MSLWRRKKHSIPLHVSNRAIKNKVRLFLITQPEGVGDILAICSYWSNFEVCVIASDTLMVGKYFAFFEEFEKGSVVTEGGWS